MKVLIISTNRYSNPMPVMPGGACLVAEAASRGGHEVRMLDLMFSRYPVRTLERTLRHFTPDVVGLSLRNIDNNDARSPRVLYDELAPLVVCIRSLTQAKIVAGGAAFGVMPDALLKKTGISYCVLGDGESVFPKLLDAFQAGTEPSEVPGIAWCYNGSVRHNPGHACHPLHNGCIPNYIRWIDIKAYQRRMCMAGVQTKRGCPFSCVYCTYAFAEGKDYRFCTAETIVDGIRRLVAAGIRDIEFVDSVFNSPYEHAFNVSESLARANTGARFQTLEMNPEFIDKELVSVMEQAGFVGLGITAESASNRVLKRLGKDYTSDDVERAASELRHCAIPRLWIFLLGGPGETHQTVRLTLDFIHTHLRPSDVAFINIGIRLYPGTILEETLRAEGNLAVSEDDMLNPVFYLSPDIDMDRLIREVEHFTDQHLNVVSNESAGLPFLPLLYRIGYRIGLRPPLWHKTPQLRKTLRFFGVKT